MTKQEYIADTQMLEKLPVFYQPWYFDLFGTDWDVKLFNDDNSYIFPYFKEVKKSFKLSRPQAFMPYYGPFKLEKESPLEKYLKNWSKNFDFILLSPHFSINTTDFKSIGFKEYSRVTHLLDLSLAEEDLLKNMDYMRRKNIKKATKELIVKENDFEVEQYFDWINKTFSKRNDKQPHSLSFFKKYVETVLANNSALVYTIYNQEGTPLSMSLILFDKNCAYSILGANNGEIKHSAATTALLWEGIKAAKNMGCTHFDFEGSKVPEIANFFSKFGAQRIDFSAWTKTNSVLWKIKLKLLG